MGKKKAFYQQEYAEHIGATILCVTSFLAVTFLSCGTPLGMLMLREWNISYPEYPGVYFERPCYTLWGMRNNCWNANYTLRVDDPKIAQCPDMRSRFEAAEAFSVIALFFLLFVLGASWYKLCGASIKTVVTLLAAFTLAATIVPFAVVTAFYHTSFCNLDFLTHKYTRFGAGYALTTTSFCIQTVGLILFIFLEPAVVEPKRTTLDEPKKTPSDATSSNEPAH
ncbi:amastin-like surface protein-like protein [Leptomonas pyrrhocoris]|uniref:Amastin-like surface protein-like protein n=1 Tax=Leptomonas pyrrhocoris TaxID=157538 RepID=A0A0N1J539_LEPPY|nr:amastin-like surface protein-like protein [Leptomonas pyrrhocoris]XP_015661533.1 amastin-like surface protein-like protein [Leptomonas pyrrhocoris]KPA83093.1 amastin-like surface protein-like protein [Leptomonas pyrrhocoris]KPA83094.1 amastin-like surface protein-like protein [Leptomonas pyrrhocoris]|eukprot:XP_015661532.1 amastin-like surface protein-like protein [Leptomonas pyrrhocoris]